MSPQEQLQRVLDPSLILILKWNELVKLGVTFQEVIVAFDKGIMLDQNLYTLRKKADVINELLDK